MNVKFVLTLKDWAMALGIVLIGLALFNGLFGASPLDSGPAPEFQLEDLD